MAESISVLHVDDNPEFGTLTETYLERGDADVEVQTVEGARRALAVLEERRVDCVVSDYDMPVMDGLELLAAVRERDPELPFVLFTGKGSEEIASEAISAGVTDYIQKGGAEQFDLLRNRIENAVEQSRARDDLEASRQRYRTVVDTLGEGIFVQDADGTITEYNEAAAEILGVPPTNIQEAILAGELDVVTEDGEPISPETLPPARVRRTGDPVSDVRVGVVAEEPQDRRWLSVGARRMEHAGEEGDVVVWFSDVTEQVRLERKLRESRSKIARLHAVATELESRTEPAEVFDIAVGAAEHILEFDDCYLGVVEEGRFRTAATTSDMTVDPDEELAADEGTAGWAYQHGESVVVDDNHADSTARPSREGFVSTVTVPVGAHGVFQAHRDEVGAFDDADLELAELLVSHVTEALDRIESEHALRESEALYRTLVEGSHDGIYIYRGDRFEFVNERVAELTGYSKAELYEMDVFELVHPDDRDRIRATARDGTGEPIVREARIIRKSGEERHMSLSTSRITYDGVPSFMGAARDVTERRRREEDLRRQNERLDEFASVVSHDLQNPLTIARGHLDVARETGDDRAFETVEQAHERMTAIVEDVLALARDGRMVDEPEPVRLADVVTAAWENTASGSAVVEIDDLGVVEADPGRLQRLFENLFSNAVQHGIERGDGEDLTVRVGEIDDGFFVADDGEGIPPDERDRVFDSGVTSSETGTGFGLAIVREIAEAHGWTVSVGESDAGGARFDVTGVDRPSNGRRRNGVPNDTY